MQKFVILISVCLLAACGGLSNSSPSSSDLQKWVGQSEYQLYNVWGKPESEFFVTPDKKVVVYVQTYDNGSPNYYSDELYYQGMGNNGGILNDLFGPPQEKQMDDYYCKISFVIEDSMVIDYNFNGDYCGGKF